MTTEPDPILHIKLQSLKEREELAFLLNRGLNTLQQHQWPKWAQMLVDVLENRHNSEMAHDSEPQDEFAKRVGVQTGSA